VEEIPKNINITRSVDGNSSSHSGNITRDVASDVVDFILASAGANLKADMNHRGQNEAKMDDGKALIFAMFSSSLPILMQVAFDDYFYGSSLAQIAADLLARLSTLIRPGEMQTNNAPFILGKSLIVNHLVKFV